MPWHSNGVCQLMHTTTQTAQLHENDKVYEITKRMRTKTEKHPLMVVPCYYKFINYKLPILSFFPFYFY